MVTRKNTTQLLAKLRQLMQDTTCVKEALQAYIVPTRDAHNSEFVADCDGYRAFITGFTGSAGTAIITLNDARLWTDGRYYIQAAEEMDDNWTLMKESLPTTPSQAVWLSKNIPKGGRVGIDPWLISHPSWKILAEKLTLSGHSLVGTDKNLISLIWEDRPERPDNPVKFLPHKFSGKSLKDKLVDIRKSMVENTADILVITELDEIAWLLNLRGSDIQYNPVFFSYAVISKDHLWVMMSTDGGTGKKLDKEAIDYLQEQAPGIQLLPYNDISKVVEECAKTDNNKIWIGSKTSQYLSSMIKEENLIVQITPIALSKAIKNETEIAGMRASHIRDGAALVRYFSWLETQVNAGEVITEISGADKLEEFRKQLENYVGLSFTTISSYGKHAAINHYHPTPETDIPIRKDKPYLCDSGAQFYDGTTDVTRTLHFGNPTEYEKECFTRVLKGQMAVRTSVFPERIKGNCLDSFARRYLWDVGLDYQHGTGHGVGHYLNVHEGPMGISWRTLPEDPGLQAGMFVSNEPGYYEDDNFGIRLEDVVEIVEAKTPYHFDNRRFLTLETITMCPIQLKMIDKSLLTEAEVKDLNSYHRIVKEKLMPLLKKFGDDSAIAWLERETQPI